jgi:hypothetical protein
MPNQQQKVLEYITAHPNKTIREIRNATKVMKPCMRISEINYAWRERNGHPHSEGKQLIITAGRNKHREALKTLAIT